MNTIKKWKTLSSTYIYKSNWATLRKDVCEMSDGRIVDDYYVLEYPAFAFAIALTEDNKVLMVRQYRQAAGIISLEIPGGVVDKGEEPSDAIKRELLEETGYQFETVEQLCVLNPNPSTANNQCFCFLATGGKKVREPKLDDLEELVVEQYTIEEVKQLLLNNQIAQAMHTAGLFYGLMRLGVL
jgi:ADP-ribose pyrophosphatase